MPTKYKPFINDNPPDVSGELERISRALGAAKEAIREVFATSLGIVLEDDLELLMEDLGMELALFALGCIALPKRSPNQLKATYGEIVKDPVKFWADPSRYDPEVIAGVFGECARESKFNNEEMMAYELGTGPGPSPEKFKSAAERMSAKLDLKLKDGRMSRGGATRDDRQERLAERLAVLFVGRGGNLRRTVQPPRRDRRDRWSAGFVSVSEDLLDDESETGGSLPGSSAVGIAGTPYGDQRCHQAAPFGAARCQWQDIQQSPCQRTRRTRMVCPWD